MGKFKGLLSKVPGTISVLSTVVGISKVAGASLPSAFLGIGIKHRHATAILVVAIGMRNRPIGLFGLLASVAIDSLSMGLSIGPRWAWDFLWPLLWGVTIVMLRIDMAVHGR